MKDIEIMLIMELTFNLEQINFTIKIYRTLKHFFCQKM